jgi:hypothetical protein
MKEYFLTSCNASAFSFVMVASMIKNIFGVALRQLFEPTKLQSASAFPQLSQISV